MITGRLPHLILLVGNWQGTVAGHREQVTGDTEQTQICESNV